MTEKEEQKMMTQVSHEAQMKENGNESLKQVQAAAWWVVGALLLLLPAVFNAFLIDAFNLPKITLFRAGLVALAGIGLWRMSSTGEFSFRRTSLDLPIAGFLIAAILSTVFSVNPFHSFFGHHMYHTEGLLAAVSFVLFFTMLTAFFSREDLERLTPFIVIAAVPVLLYGLLQSRGIDFIDWQTSTARISSSLGNPNFLGGYIALVLPFFFAFAAQWKGIRRWGVIILIVLAFWCLLHSFSRAGVLGTIASTVAFFYFTGSDKVKKNLLRGFAVLALIAALVVTVQLIRTAHSDTESLRGPSNTFARFWDRVDVNDTNVQARARYLGIAVDMFLKKPVLGYGLDTFAIIWRRHMTLDLIPLIGGNPLANPGYAHSEFFQVLATQGIVGLLAYGWLLFSILRRGISSMPTSRNRRLQAAAVAAVIGTIVNNQFSFFSAPTAVYFWFLAAFIAAEPGTKEIAVPVKFTETLASIAGIGLAVLLFFAVKAYWAETYFPKGLFLESRRRYDEAITYFVKATKTFPYEQTYYQNLGKVLITRAGVTSDPAQKKIFLDASVKAYSRHLALIPQDALSWNGLGIAHINLALISSDKEEFDRAETALRTSIKEAPVFLEPYINLGSILYMQGKKQEALDIYRQAIDINPREPLIYLNLGNIYAQEGDMKRALAFWQDVLDLDPNNVQAKLNIEQNSARNDK